MFFVIISSELLTFLKTLSKDLTTGAEGTCRDGGLSSGDFNYKIKTSCLYIYILNPLVTVTFPIQTAHW